MSSESPDAREIREPQFLHYSSILFDLASHGRELLMPAIFGFVGAASGSWFWGAFAAVAFALAVLRTVFRYFTLRYRVAKGELAVHEGWVFRTQRTVPLTKIQNLDLRQNVLHRLFGVAEVRIETASGAEAEAVLRVLTKSQVEQLRAAIFGSVKRADSVASLSPDTTSDARPEAADGSGTRVLDLEHPPGLPVADRSRGAAPKTLVRIPLRWLIVAGLAGNRGWLMVGLAIGAFFQFDLHERFLPPRWERWLARLRLNWDDVWANWPVLLAIFVAGLLLLKILGVAWYIYRFYGYRLERSGEDLRVSAGLLSSYSTSIPRQRIQFVSLHRPWVLGWFGFVSLRIETAGGAGGNENGQENLARTWFVPVVPAALAVELLTEIRPELKPQEDALAWQGVAAGTTRRLAGIGLLSAAILTGPIGWWWWPWGALSGLVAAPLTIAYAYWRGHSLKYARTDEGVVFRSGLFYRKLSYTFYDRIQTISLAQSPFDRRWGMATLMVDTAAAGPADHVIAIPYLDAEVARHEFQVLQSAAAANRPHWK
jgi:putative membrane protein